MRVKRCVAIPAGRIPRAATPKRVPGADGGSPMRRGPPGNLTASMAPGDGGARTRWSIRGCSRGEGRARSGRQAPSAPGAALTCPCHSDHARVPAAPGSARQGPATGCPGACRERGVVTARGDGGRDRPRGAAGHSPRPGRRKRKQESGGAAAPHGLRHVARQDEALRHLRPGLRGRVAPQLWSPYYNFAAIVLAPAPEPSGVTDGTTGSLAVAAVLPSPRLLKTNWDCLVSAVPGTILGTGFASLESCHRQHGVDDSKKGQPT